MDQIRVLHVLTRMNAHGTEVRLLELMGRLCPEEFCVDVCVHSGLAGPLDSEVHACGGSVIPLRLNASFPGRFVRLLRQGRYSVVHSHLLHTSGAILALAARAGTPVRIAHFHATHDGHRSTLRRRVQRSVMLRLIDRYATDIIACGEGAMDAIWRAGWRSDPRCRVIYDAVDVMRFQQPVDRGQVRADLGIPTGARLFVHVGREAPEKNHRRLLEIFAEIRKTAPGAWLVLAGDGTNDPDGHTSRAAHELSIQDRVVALGIRDDVPRLLKAADVLLLPSRSEGLPGVVLEACAAGLPVLATDLPGVTEIASRLSLVRHLPLIASDAEWAMAALALPAEAARLRLRDTAAGAFRTSVFDIDHAARAHRLLWGRVAGRGALASC